MNTVWRALILAVLLASTVLAMSPDYYEPRYRLQIRASYRAQLKEQCNVEDVHVLDNGAYMDVYVTPVQLEAIQQAKINYRIAEQAQPLRKKFPNYNMPNGYLDFEGIIDFLDDIAKQYPSIATLVDMSQYGAGLTYEGNPFPALKISGNVTIDEDEPNILIVGNHHAREIVTPHLVMDAISRLTSGYSTDSEIREIVDNNQIYLIPVWNPDGYIYAWDVNNMWRKNRKPNTGGSYGVDQNRNYGLGWDSSCSGSSVPTSETYKGPHPDSEEETQTMEAFTLDRNLVKVLDFHSYGREVLYHYTCTPMAAFLERYIEEESYDLADFAGYSWREPSGDGQHQEWTIARTSAYSFLVETCNQFQPSYELAKQEADRVWPLTKRFLQRTIPLSGRVLSSNTGLPVQAEIYVDGLQLEVWRSDPKFGSYRVFLPDGTYNIKFVPTSGGGSSVDMKFTIVNSTPQVSDVYV